MSFKLRDFSCECGHEWEDLLETGETESVCEECGMYNKPVLSCPNLNTMNLLPRSEYVAKMKKRSADHSHKELKRAPERFGKAGMDQLKKHT